MRQCPPILVAHARSQNGGCICEIIWYYNLASCACMPSVNQHTHTIHSSRNWMSLVKEKWCQNNSKEARVAMSKVLYTNSPGWRTLNIAKADIHDSLSAELGQKARTLLSTFHMPIRLQNQPYITEARCLKIATSMCRVILATSVTTFRLIFKNGLLYQKSSYLSLVILQVCHRPSYSPPIHQLFHRRGGVWAWD